MALKVTFSGSTKQIIVKPNVTEIDVKIDLYSDWKEWVLEDSNARYLEAFRTFGGDPTISGQYAPSYFFLTNGWRIVVGNDEDVSFGVNLYTEEGDTPFIVGSGSSVTNRNSDAVTVDTGVGQSLDYNGIVHINTSIGVGGTTYPIGTLASPVNNLSDAKTIANDLGISNYHIYGTVDFDVELHDSTVFGGNAYDIVNLMNVNLSGCTFNECIVGGQYTGSIKVNNSELLTNLQGMEGHYYNCGIRGNLFFNDNITSSMIDCYSLVPGTSSPQLFLGENINLSIRKYSGGLGIYDCGSGTTSTIEFLAGNCRILTGNTAGNIVVRGIASFTNQSSGTTINTSGLLIPQNVAQQHSVNVQTEIIRNL